jgi:single-strand DNA-binding protein
MNNVNIVGIVDGDAEMVYQSREGGKSLFKFKVRVTRTFKNKLGEFQDDIINIKV